MSDAPQIPPTSNPRTEADAEGRPASSGPRPAEEVYDLVIIGTGEGSKFLAWTLGKEGKRVAVIERRYIGGSCPNIACLPSKNVIHSAKVASYVRRAAEFGVASGGLRVDMAAVRERKRRMVAELVAIHVANFKASGVEVIMGSAAFTGPKTIAVALNDGGTRTVRADQIVIGTGTRATIADIPGLRAARPLTHIELLELGHLPAHLVVLGGGYIGLELAQAMRRFGSAVTIIDRNARLASREDADVSDGLEQLCKDEGIELVLGAEVARVEGVSGSAVTLHVRQGGAERAIACTDLLVAAGRTPNTDGIGLDRAGVQLTDRGYIAVDERLQTTAPGVWAIGECAGSAQFTHVAYDDYRIVRDNLAGGHRVTTGRQVPFCLFTDPELARIGLSEREAKASGTPYRLAKITVYELRKDPRNLPQRRLGPIGHRANLT